MLRALLWVALPLLILAALVRLAGSRQLEQAESRARGSLEPIEVHELAKGRSEGADPGPWLVNVAQSKPRWTLAELATPAGRDAVLARLDAGELADAGRAAARGLRAAWEQDGAGGDADWPPLVARLEQRLEHAAGLEPWLRSERALLAVIALGGEDLVNLALDARGLSSIDPQAVLAALDKEAAAFPQLPALQELELARACRATALHGALRQDPGLWQAGVDGLSALVRVHDQPDWLMAAVLHQSHLRTLCDLLELSIPHLPRDWDLGATEELLAVARPREALRRAMIGERAFGLRVWTMVDEDAQLPDAPSSMFDALLVRLFVDRDRAAYLDRWQTALGAARIEAYARGAAAAELSAKPSRWTIRTSLMMPELGEQLEHADRTEARVLLARGALVAWRGGAQEALPWFAKSVDPYDGKPLRAALGDGGLVQLWSTGRDGRDDEGELERDIVWRMRIP